MGSALPRPEARSPPPAASAGLPPRPGGRAFLVELGGAAAVNTPRADPRMEMTRGRAWRPATGLRPRCRQVSLAGASEPRAPRRLRQPPPCPLPPQGRAPPCSGRGGPGSIAPPRHLTVIVTAQAQLPRPGRGARSQDPAAFTRKQRRKEGCGGQELCVASFVNTAADLRGEPEGRQRRVDFWLCGLPASRLNTLATPWFRGFSGELPADPGAHPTPEPAFLEQPRVPTPEPAIPEQPRVPSLEPAFPEQPRVPSLEPVFPEQPQVPIPEPTFPEQPWVPTPEPAFPEQPRVPTPEPAFPEQPRVPTPEPAILEQPRVPTPEPTFPEQPRVPTPEPASPEQPRVRTAE
ncbi:PGC-1 and ERR-induced regulator in muscle protein 1-like [Moschus berezovskii]|uniref:PGC-1 and ERR-induced regulator in muscle protein 1-like n=1 Tax=Moschus berezovskii TaxID=68408 RepID=UPI002443A044|nr:PGC-1 and ERR-induced regulator in muscle protein 1-like [Moschus berezovskii]